VAGLDWADLEARMRELAELRRIGALLSWDQQTKMPPRGAEARARARATIRVLQHRRLVDPALGELLEGAADADLDAHQAACVRLLLRDQRQAVRLSDELVRRMALAAGRGHAAWEEARRRADYEIFKPHLAELVDLKREHADLLGHGGVRYDALLDLFEPGMHANRLRPLFAALNDELVALVDAIRGAPQLPPPPYTGREFADQPQWDFTMRLLADLGFDLEAGRQDLSVHPFSTDIGRHDVRVTTRIFPDDPFSSVYSTIHEAGHGMYSQGHDERYEDLPVADAPSLGAHESQSRLWENIVGRSRPFWEHYTPVIREYLGDTIGGATVDDLYREVNRVAPSLIRVEADEVTYNLHIMIRFELELALMAGDLDVDELPAAWNDAYERRLGVRPQNDVVGVLQDTHWSEGAFGYFPTYSLGNLYAAMLWRALAADIPDVDEQIAAGRFDAILGWLREHVHEAGSLEECEPMMRRVTGLELSHEPLMDYLWSKYGALYGVARATA
jgi:carboxypeptidase Taq